MELLPADPAVRLGTGGGSLVRMPRSKGRRKPKTAGRPTPPKSAASRGKKAKESSKLYVAVMFGLMALGVLLVVTRYVLDTPSWLLLVGLASMGGGFLMTTNYH